MLDMHHITLKTTITFYLIQRLTMLLDQQQVALDGFITSFMDDVGIIMPFTLDAIENLETSSYIVNGRYVVSLSFVQKFVSGMAFQADYIFDKVNQAQQIKIWNDTGFVYVIIYN